MKKSLLIALTFIIGTSQLFTQTPFASTQSGSSSNLAAGLSANSPWLGAQIGYLFGDSDEFTDNLLASGRIIQNIEISDNENFMLPIVGNFSTLLKDFSASDTAKVKEFDMKIKDLYNNSRGLNIGLYPYYKAIEKDKFSLLVHGAALWKLNSLKDSTDTAFKINQLKFYAGVEFGFGKRKDDKIPVIVSLTPAFTVILDKENYKKALELEEAKTLSSLEISVVIPLVKGFGLMIEDILPFNNAPNIFRAGIIINSELAN